MTKLHAWGFYLAIPALIVLFAYMIWGEGGFMDLTRFKEEEARVMEKNREIMAENQRIEEIISRLKHDGTYIEHLAKHELGLAGEKELIFRFEPHGPSSKGAASMDLND